MVKVGGLEAGLAGVVFIIAKFWDAVTDYFMGRISDKTKCKFGKRRIYINNCTGHNKSNRGGYIDLDNGNSVVAAGCVKTAAYNFLAAYRIA